MRYIGAKIKSYLATGLLVTGPLGITIYIGWWLLNGIDSIIPAIIPAGIIPKIPGLGLIILLFSILIVGGLFTTILGRIFMGYYEKILGKLPYLSSIYQGVKQIFETFLSHKSQAFSKAVLIEYPRAGSWTIAFITASPKGEIADKLPNDGDYTMVYVPTTPNPTSGFLLMINNHQIKPLDMPVEQAIKLVISLGIVEN